MQQTRNAIVTLAALSLLALAIPGCTGAQPTTTAAPLVVRTQPIALAEMTCPVSGEPVTCCSEAAYFESFPVYCADRASARQFGSLDMRQRARLGAEQVLAQKGIANTICPITGEPLTAIAAPAIFEGEAIGFGSPALANQFRSLPEKSKVRVIAQWREEEKGSAEEPSADTAEG